MDKYRDRNLLARGDGGGRNLFFAGVLNMTRPEYETQAEAVHRHCGTILQAVTQLTLLLPEKESEVGSRCFKIERFTLELARKYSNFGAHQVIRNMPGG